MSSSGKRKEGMADGTAPKKVKTECTYGENCYRKNPTHLRVFSHPHLESILDKYKGTGPFPIPPRLTLHRHMITEQLQIMVDKEVYEYGKDAGDQMSARELAMKLQGVVPPQSVPTTSKKPEEKNSCFESASSCSHSMEVPGTSQATSSNAKAHSMQVLRNKSGSPIFTPSLKDSHYRPIVPPKRRPEELLRVVRPFGAAAAKHAASAPYHVFYTAVADAPRTHDQPYSITFLELLDSSFGELKSSLQINFMVEPGWLLAQYYFAGYGGKRLTILYEDSCNTDMKMVEASKPHVDTHKVEMATPFGKHHTKLMILNYEDGSLRVVVSTANLYVDDWENRTQGLWMSPRCPPLPPDAVRGAGDSPTEFRHSLLRYLSIYQLPCLDYYMDRVKNCDFSHINVFLITSVPGSHSEAEWGMRRVGSLLRRHCVLPSLQAARWPLLAQASSLGAFGTEPKKWLMSEFLNNFTMSKTAPPALNDPPELKIIYPSLHNVRRSHDDLLGGCCLPYSGEVHARQPWLTQYLYQWKAIHTHRDKAMPHIKSYLRLSPDATQAAYFLLSSGNLSKAAWGVSNKGNGALRIMSYEVGVLFLPKFVINKDFFPLEQEAENRLIIPYDLPPTKYTSDMAPWVTDYLR